MARKPGSKGEDTVASARSAALRLFAEMGYSAASMRRLAAEIGVQPGALYNYWPTKQDLLVDLLDRHMQDLLTSWARRASELARRDADPQAELDAFARFHIGYHLDKPDEVFLSYMELRSLEPENFRRIEAARRRYERSLSDIIARGVSSKRMIAPDPHVAAMAAIAMLTGVTTWFRSSGRLSPAEVTDLYAGMVLRSVGLEPRPHNPNLETPTPRRTGAVGEETACSDMA